MPYPHRRPRPPLPPVEIIAAAYHGEGLTTRQLGVRYGCSDTLIERVLHEGGVQLRRPGGRRAADTPAATLHPAEVARLRRAIGLATPVKQGRT